MLIQAGFKRSLKKLISSFLIITLLFSIGVLGDPRSTPVAYALSAPTYVSTFESIGLYWNPNVPNQGTMSAAVQYRIAGSQGAWQDAMDLWYDERTTGGRAAEFRGSIVGLIPGTDYEVKLTLTNGENASIIAKTMSEHFPVGETVNLPLMSTEQLVISTGGTSSAYKLYTFDPATGTATIDVQKAANTCITVTAPYVIIRGISCKGAAQHGIAMEQGTHHVVIENNDISDWGSEKTPGTGLGRDYQSAIMANQPNPSVNPVTDTVIQRNKIHDPTYTTNTWDFGHPEGPQGITFMQFAGGHHIVRYNEITGSDGAIAGKDGHYFNDGIGGGPNYSLSGGPGADSDIYGNIVTHTYDDAIETEGGNRNVRVWGNYLDKTGTGIASASTSIGPYYVFRNVYNRSRILFMNTAKTAYVSPDLDDIRGGFAKVGDSVDDPTLGGGRRYYFHNTTLQAPGGAFPLGPGPGIYDAGGPLTNTVSRNNIWQSFKTWRNTIQDARLSTTNDFDYDLSSGQVVAYAGAEPHGLLSKAPIYEPNNGYVSGAGGRYALAPTSPGYHTGVAIKNFNSGTNVDMGAHQSGTAAMQFGLNAYSSNRAPIVYAGSAITTGRTASLAGVVYDDGMPSGILTKTWSKVSGPGTVLFSDVSSASPVATFSATGTYVLRLTASDGSLTTASDVTVYANIELPYAVLTGANQVEADASFDLTFGIRDVTASTYQSVYAQIVTINYDPSTLELSGVTSAVTGFAVLTQKQVTPGQVRVAAASLGPDHALAANSDSLKLSFKAKPTNTPVNTNVSVNQIQIANSSGGMMQVDGASHALQIQLHTVNRALLQAAIEKAQGDHDASEEGIRIGQYPSGSKATLQAAINAAVSVRQHEAATPQDINLALTNLNAAVQLFEDSVIKPVQGQVSVADLGIAVAAYGKTSTDPNWSRYKFADSNHDNVIDILDLVAIAQMLFE
ncbi:hypothetical protein GCM10020370_64250 [Paenibacillus hodogayensis]